MGVKAISILETVQNQYFRVNPLRAKRAGPISNDGWLDAQNCTLLQRRGLRRLLRRRRRGKPRLYELTIQKPPRKGAWDESVASSCRRRRFAPCRAGSGRAARDRSRTAGSS